MKAIILAAGIGSRLRPITNSKPKCLVTSAGKNILQYQLDAYKKAGIKDLCIVVGYEGGAIVEYCKHIHDFNITIIENEQYENTNNMYSLYLAREFVSDSEFILNNADLTVEDDIIQQLIDDEREDLIAVDTSMFNDESMKVSVNTVTGVINDISKQIIEAKSSGCSIDFYKFSKSSGRVFIDEVTRIVEEEENLKDWTEVAMQRLFQKNMLQFYIKDISGTSWVEIDNYDDLALSDKIFSQKDKAISDYKHYCFDLDGTIYVGSNIIPNAADKILELQELGKYVSFLSNNSSKNKIDYVNRLKKNGISSTEEQIALSTDSVVKFLKGNKVENIFVLGTIKLLEAFINHGFEITKKSPEYIVVGYDTELTYQKLIDTCALINSGIDYVATHCDVYCPSEFGPIPDIGALTKLLSVTTGVEPKYVFGKPMPSMIKDICEKRGVALSDTLMIGDRLYTDIEMANKAGVDSLLVLSGDTKRDQIEESRILPTYVLRSIAEM